MRVLLIVITVLVGVTLGHRADSRESPRSETIHTIEPLTVYEVRTPPVTLPNYQTSGTYVQVASDRVDLMSVNATLRNAVLSSQRHYARYVRENVMPRVPMIFEPPYPFRGVYRTSPRLRLISASTLVVSVLIPLERRVPGGTGSATWLAATVQIPSGSRVGLLQLFSEPTRGLRALASEAKRQVLASNACVRASFENPIGRRLNARGFAPRVRNYQRFGLTSTGIAVGFPQGRIGGGSCGSVLTIVRYEAIRPFLSTLGERLVAGIRNPRRK